MLLNVKQINRGSFEYQHHMIWDDGIIEYYIYVVLDTQVIL